jgi:hypothetical protein
LLDCTGNILRLPLALKRCRSVSVKPFQAVTKALYVFLINNILI